MRASVIISNSRGSLAILLRDLGEKSKDFIECFDVKSKWCEKYAALIMRGRTTRKLEYAERHHIIPVSFYRYNGYIGNRWGKDITDNNLAVLSFGEHLYTHYLAVRCSKPQYVGGCAAAFWKLYKCNSKTKGHLPEDFEIMGRIDGLEATRVRSMMPSVSKVTERGGTHSWEDIKKQKKEWAQLNAESLRDKHHCWYMTHREECLIKSRIYHQNNPEVHLRASRKYCSTHREEIKEKSKKFYNENKELCAVRNKASYEKHKDTRRAAAKVYREVHRPERLEYNKLYYESHKLERLAYGKAWAKQNPEKVKAKSKKYKDAKVAAGYRWRMDKTLGKRTWVFVGNS